MPVEYIVELIDDITYNEVVRLYNLDFIDTGYEMNINHSDMFMEYLGYYLGINVMRLPYADLLNLCNAVDDYVWYSSKSNLSALEDVVRTLINGR